MNNGQKVHTVDIHSASLARVPFRHFLVIGDIIMPLALFACSTWQNIQWVHSDSYLRKSARAQNPLPQLREDTLNANSSFYYIYHNSLQCICILPSQAWYLQHVRVHNLLPLSDIMLLCHMLFYSLSSQLHNKFQIIYLDFFSSEF